MPSAGAVLPVILAGGSGTRLWPASRADLPKQFSPLFAGGTLFERTLRRLEGAPFAPPLVVTAESFAALARRQMSGTGATEGRLALEPAPRNTAPAVALALALAGRRDPETLMLVLPSDHLVRDERAFRQAVEAGLPAARAGQVVLFGVRPTRPERAFGYIELAAPAGTDPAPFIGFAEKPDAARARELLAGGRHLWNAGIFFFRADVMRAAFAAHAPRILALCEAAVAGGEERGGAFHPDPDPWSRCPAISLDHAVIEPLGRGQVVPLDCGWNDLGSWRTVWEESRRDAAGTALRGAASALDCRDSLLLAPSHGPRLVGLGLEGMLAVAVRDAVLVAPLARSAEVGRAVEALAREGAPEALEGPLEAHEWGVAETLRREAAFTLRRLEVDPGKELEAVAGPGTGHWLAVAGHLEVAPTGREPPAGRFRQRPSLTLEAGEGCRLRNPGPGPLVLLEVRLAGPAGPAPHS